MVTKSRRRRAAELEAELAAAEQSSNPEEGEEPSRSARKRESHELRDLGVELVQLRREQLAALALPTSLFDAVNEARRLSSFGAQRRQAQYIGKLIRRLDEDTLAAIRKAVDAARQ